MADEIIRGLWRINDGIAGGHGFDPDALVAHLRRVSSGSGRVVVDLRSTKQKTRADAAAEKQRPRS